MGEARSEKSALRRYGPGLLLPLAIAALAMFLQSQITVSGKPVVSAVAARRGRVSLKAAVPGFVLGFVAMAVLNSLGAFPPTALDTLRPVSAWLIVIALAGVGLETDLAALRAIGLRPFYAGLCAATFMAAISFGLIRLFGIG